MLEALEELMQGCKGSVTIEINPHHRTYETAAEYLASERADAPTEIQREMEARDRVVHVQAYPKTPIGFFCVYHYDVVVAVTDAARILGELKLKQTNPD